MDRSESGKLEIVIKNVLANYDYLEDKLVLSKGAVGRNRKNGYLVFDKTDRNIGIAFMSDDERTSRYGNSELMFFKEYKTEFGRWRTFKVQGEYYMYNILESKLADKGQVEIVLDAQN